MWYLACCCVAGRRIVQLLVDLFLEHQGFVACLKWFSFFNLELENEENIYINLNISHIRHFFTHNFSRLFAISKLCEIAVPILRGAKNGICRSIEKQIVIHSDCNFPQRREKRTQRRQKLHSGQYNNSDHTIAKKSFRPYHSMPFSSYLSFSFWFFWGFFCTNFFFHSGFPFKSCLNICIDFLLLNEKKSIEVSLNSKTIIGFQMFPISTCPILLTFFSFI